ncbi:MAG: hypothetical protein FJW38_17970 [Acidobacteria bacterium]|nr:hypothetical protein [Acidobacteriota bacterium]
MLFLRAEEIVVVAEHSQTETRLVGSLEFDVMYLAVAVAGNHIGAFVGNLRLFGRQVLLDLTAKEPAANDAVARVQEYRLYRNVDDLRHA